jgi:hypothetical protein
MDELGHIWGMGWEDSDTPHPDISSMFGAYH